MSEDVETNIDFAGQLKDRQRTVNDLLMKYDSRERNFIINNFRYVIFHNSHNLHNDDDDDD